MVPKGLFTAGFLARLLHEKYVLGRPVHRVVAALAAEGLQIAPGTLAGELRQVAPLLAPWAQAIAARGRLAGYAMRRDLLAGFEDVADKENHRWWLWTFVTPDTTVFVMDPSRSARVAAGQLGIDLSETALEQAGAGHHLRLPQGLPVAGPHRRVDALWCWAHIRRYFLRAAPPTPMSWASRARRGPSGSPCCTGPTTPWPRPFPAPAHTSRRLHAISGPSPAWTPPASSRPDWPEMAS